MLEIKLSNRIFCCKEIMGGHFWTFNMIVSSMLNCWEYLVLGTYIFIPVLSFPLFLAAQLCGVFWDIFQISLFLELIDLRLITSYLIILYLVLFAITSTIKYRSVMLKNTSSAEVGQIANWWCKHMLLPLVIARLVLSHHAATPKIIISITIAEYIRGVWVVSPFFPNVSAYHKCMGNLLGTLLFGYFYNIDYVGIWYRNLLLISLT